MLVVIWVILENLKRLSKQNMLIPQEKKLKKNAPFDTKLKELVSLVKALKLRCTDSHKCIRDERHQ